MTAALRLLFSGRSQTRKGGYTAVNLFEEFREEMPTNEETIAEGVRLTALRYGDTVESIKSDFSALVEKAHDEIYRIYLQHEKKQGERVLAEFIAGNKGKPLFEALNAFFLSLGNSRKSRAGSAFEEVVRRLFRYCKYPFDEQRVINGTPDFIMPSEEHFRRHAADCIVFTIKRTLRERWRQIVTEGAQTARFFLATLDKKITANSLSDMRKRNISLVVPADAKSKVAHYTKALNVTSFEDFFEDHLDPAVARWKKQKLI